MADYFYILRYRQMRFAGKGDPDYLFSFLPDYNRSEFVRSLLSIKTEHGSPIFSLRVTLEKGRDNLWHKIWRVEVN